MSLNNNGAPTASPTRNTNYNNVTQYVPTPVAVTPVAVTPGTTVGNGLNNGQATNWQLGEHVDTGSLNAGDARNEYRTNSYSNQNAYTGGSTGTGSYDFGSVDLTGSGGGGGMDDSLAIDSGVPLTKRNPMLRKNVVSYNNGGRHDNPYMYSQGGMMDQQDGNGVYWQNMAARIGQKNAGVAMQQTQNIINGNGKGNPYQMPDQRNMMPNAQFSKGGQFHGILGVEYDEQGQYVNPYAKYTRWQDQQGDSSLNQGNAINREVKSRYDQGGMLGGNDNSIRGLISGAMQDVNAQMMPRQSQAIPMAKQGMKMNDLSNKERLANLLKAVPNKDAFNKLSKSDQDSFEKTWAKYGGVTTKKRRFTSGGRF